MKLSYSTTPRRGGRDSILKDALIPPFTASEISRAIEANDKFVEALERMKEDRLVDQQIS